MTITKLTAPFMLTAALLIAPACDSEELDPDTELRADDDAAPEADDTRADHKRGRHNPAERLCQELACSDDQRSQIEALFVAQKDARKARKAERGDRGDRKAKRAELNAELAAAFRADSFDGAVLERELGDAVKHGARLDHAAELIVGLHAILNTEQRAQLADRIEARGPWMLGGKHRGHHGPKGKKGRHGKRGADGDRDDEGRRGDNSPEQRLAHKVERLCETLSCTEDQKTRLSAAFEGAHEARRDRPKPDFTPLADSFRSASVDVDGVTAILAANKPDRSAHLEAVAGFLAEVHDILTPEQRAIVADKIEVEGMRGLKGKRHHGKRGKHKRGASN